MTSPNQLSFLPDDYLDRKAQRRALAICLVLFTLVLGGVVSACAISRRATEAAEVRMGAINDQYLAEGKRLDQARQMQDKQKRMAHQAELTSSLLEKVPRSNILAEVTNAAAPSQVSLLDFTLESRAATSAGPAPDAAGKTAYELKKAARSTAAGGKGAPQQAEAKKMDVSIKLTGIAQNDAQVAQFLKSMSRSPLFKDVNLVITDEFKLNDEKMRKFQIEMMVNPNAEVRLLTPKPAAAASTDPKE